MKKQLNNHLAKDPFSQHIIYTHSRKKAEGSLRDMAETALQTNRKMNGGPISVTQAFVRIAGIMHKCCMMDSIKNYNELNDEGTELCPTLYKLIVVGAWLDGGHDPVRLPKVQIICATKSAKAGINGNSLKHGKMIGITSSLYKLTQQFGQ